ncbi:cytidine deaminase [Prescottella agglutinans]|uniref:Cytidine deaminase n=1 Tax=Prescottella agglutinans TaxID=1644129 RepID=A0A3S3EDI6_9NOCA|nr:cytidine deaminase [Prescottella agglutinans]
MTLVGWKLLRDNARRASLRSCAPYFGYPVGAGSLTGDGHIVAGCNVENVSYGLGLCAECVLAGNFVAGGGGRLTALTCCDGSGEILMPCGCCRQLLLGGARAGVTSAGTPDRRPGFRHPEPA